MKLRFAAFAGTVRRIVGFVFVFTGGGVAALNFAGMCHDFSFDGISWLGVISAVLIAVCGFLISQPNASVSIFGDEPEYAPRNC